MVVVVGGSTSARMVGMVWLLAALAATAAVASAWVREKRRRERPSLADRLRP